MTIVYTTHYMEEAERCAIVSELLTTEKIIAQGTLDELRTSGSMKENRCNFFY